MSHHKIIPNIWFHTGEGSISKILEYYQEVFDRDFQAGQVISLGETPSGRTEMCDVKIFGQKFSLMSTAEAHQPLNDAISFMINCADQVEIDKYWDYFTREGEESQCGWCIDKYGLRWQVIPENMGELMGKPNAFQVMMGQTKIVIGEYFQ